MLQRAVPFVEPAGVGSLDRVVNGAQRHYQRVTGLMPRPAPLMLWNAFRNAHVGSLGRLAADHAAKASHPSAMRFAADLRLFKHDAA